MYKSVKAMKDKINIHPGWVVWVKVFCIFITAISVRLYFFRKIFLSLSLYVKDSWLIFTLIYNKCPNDVEYIFIYICMCCVCMTVTQGIDTHLRVEVYLYNVFYYILFFLLQKFFSYFFWGTQNPQTGYSLVLL